MKSFRNKARKCDLKYNYGSDEAEEEVDAPKGFMHMNERNDADTFELTICSVPICVKQDPSCVYTELGHGAVVWDAAIIFAKFLEIDKQFSGSKVHPCSHYRRIPVLSCC